MLLLKYPALAYFLLHFLPGKHLPIILPFSSSTITAMTRSFPIALLYMVAIPSLISAQDIEGTKDHPLITRYPGATIKYFEDQKFTTYNIATGPQTGYKEIKQWVKADGRLTRIYYEITGTTTVTEIYRNYQTALNKGGFKILAEGLDDTKNVSQKIGGRTFLNTFYESNPYASGKNIRLLQGTPTSGGTAYIAATLKKPEGEVFVTVSTAQYTATEKTVLVDILEKTQMEDDLIKVDAGQMLKGIKADGKIALYGIFFDFDKADIKPESKPALDEIARLLRDNPSLNLYVVGHSDMQGTLEYNKNLSEKRARAITDELIKNYNIAASRLVPAGVGPLAPISTNGTDAGKKLNRRVELVAR